MFVRCLETYSEKRDNIISEVAARKIVEDLICDVSEELETAEQYHLNKKAIDFDIVSIIEEQNAIHDKYGCKMREK